tara:strand:- start:590 stop:1363 length:774 start_codon:yes stop_codon:yes gene_type:complete
MLKQIINILKRNIYFKHITLASITLFFLFFLWLFSLDVYTLHNKKILVPNFSNFTLDKVDSISKANNLRYIIIDSIYDRTRARGICINQIPKDSTFVKKNRRIYLTINAKKSKKINFPDIYDLSLRQAVRKLQQYDLEVGELFYKPDIAVNKVLKCEINGIKIDEGQELYIGSKIDLILGEGLKDEKVLIPNLIGLTREEANIIVKSKSINIGIEIYTNSVLDSNSAIIYKQNPMFKDEESFIKIGSSIDLFFENPD